MENNNKFKGKNKDEIFAMYGGENIRGVISKVMLEMYKEGYTRSQIADILKKRYQHVRNVLVEDAKKRS